VGENEGRPIPARRGWNAVKGGRARGSRSRAEKGKKNLSQQHNLSRIDALTLRGGGREKRARTSYPTTAGKTPDGKGGPACVPQKRHIVHCSDLDLIRKWERSHIIALIEGILWGGKGSGCCSREKVFA